MISNSEGTKRVKYVPTGRDIVGKCINEYGKEVDGLTYEGELNKVGTYDNRYTIIGSKPVVLP